MSSYFSNNLRILLAKRETVSGVAEPLADVDFDARVWDPVVTPTVEVDDEASKYATGDHGECESIMGAQSAAIDFSVKMNSAPQNSLSRPAWFKFARACGCKVTEYQEDSAAVGYALQPKKTRDVSTMTIYVFDIPRSGGKAACYVFAGCMGNMTIGAEGVGKPWTANFSFTGKLKNIEEVEQSAIPALDLKDTAIAEKLLNYSLAFAPDGGNPQKISTFLLDTGNEISPLIDQADPTGYAYYSITKRSPRFSCNPLMNGSFEALFSAWKGGGTFPVALEPVQPENPAPEDSAGFKLFIPNAQQLTAAVASREGLVNWDLNLKALRNDGAEEKEDQEVTWELVIGEKTGMVKPGKKAVKKKAGSA